MNNYKLMALADEASDSYDKYYKDMIVECLKQWKKAKKKDIKNLLWDKLPDGLTDRQKESKIKNLFMRLQMKI